MPAANTSSVEVPANFNRASAGYSWDVLLAMLAPLVAVYGRFYCYSGGPSHSETIGNRDNANPVMLADSMEAAADLLRSRYGLKVRLMKDRGYTCALRVYGPTRGGAAGRYSA